MHVVDACRFMHACRCRDGRGASGSTPPRATWHASLSLQQRRAAPREPYVESVWPNKRSAWARDSYISLRIWAGVAAIRRRTCPRTRQAATRRLSRTSLRRCSKRAHLRRRRTFLCPHASRARRMMVWVTTRPCDSARHSAMAWRPMQRTSSDPWRVARPIRCRL